MATVPLGSLCYRSIYALKKPCSTMSSPAHDVALTTSCPLCKLKQIDSHIASIPCSARVLVRDQRASWVRA